MSEQPKEQVVDISESVLELAQIMRENPHDWDRSLAKKGEVQLGIFQDPNFSDQFQNLKELKKEILLLVAEDLARGIVFLRTSVFGISFNHGKLHTYIIPHGNNPEGNVVYSVSWRNIRAFLGWKKKEKDHEIEQDTIHACLYYIARELSRLLVWIFAILILSPNPDCLAAINNKSNLRTPNRDSLAAHRAPMIFDLPVTYNPQVSYWIAHFQSTGRKWFEVWLERSSMYMPFLQRQLEASGLPLDLAYMVMIESGFSATARSKSGAVGPWQFIASTGKNYGLLITPQIDERMDIEKSTGAAIRYLKDLYREFQDWHLVAASYNMGENGLRRLIHKYHTKNFWTLAKIGALPEETKHYVPKIIAAMLISKAPSLYGFTNYQPRPPLQFEKLPVKGGKSLSELARLLMITEAALKELNPHLLQAHVPAHLSHYFVKVPPGAKQFLSARYSLRSPENVVAFD